MRDEGGERGIEKEGRRRLSESERAVSCLDRSVCRF